MHSFFFAQMDSLGQEAHAQRPLTHEERVRKITSAFRAEDQIVIEILRELDSDTWETIVSYFQFRLMNHWTENTDKLWKTHLVVVVKKKNGKLTMRGFRPIAMLQTIYRLYSKTLQQLAGQALQSRRGPQSGHVSGQQAHEVVWIVENSGLRDGLRCDSCV